MKILITGASGQVGSKILSMISDKHQLLVPNRSTLDLSQYDKCKEYVLFYKPDLIINCGAYTKVDQSETEVELAYKINADAPRAFCEALKDTGGEILHISTDFVFNGLSNRPYNTFDVRDPLSVYGKSKAKGEKAIEDILFPLSKGTILRTSWVISPIRENFLLTILRLNRQRDSINVVCDQLGSPTSSKTIAKACLQFIDLRTRYIDLDPILHVTDMGVASWYDLAVSITDLLYEFSVLPTTAKINPIFSCEYPTKAARPYFSVLNTLNSMQQLDIKGIHWRNSLKDIIKEL